MAMSAWQWCIGVSGNMHVSHSVTPCGRQARGVSVWYETGGRESGGGGDLSFGPDEVVVFTCPDGTGRPLSCTGSSGSSDSEC